MNANSPAEVVVAVAQINNSFSGQNYFPYCSALLEAYARKHARRPERYRFLLPIYARLPVEEAVERLLPADVVGFSAYVWNIQLSLAIAQRLKSLRPDVLIVFGGPQVPASSESFLRQNPCVDVACHGAGEETFLALLQSYPQRNWSAIEAVSYLDGEGRFVPCRAKPHLKDLSQVPSPYLDGTLDRLMAAQPGTTWLGLWETNRGCPFSCSFCDWGSAVLAKVHGFPQERLLAEIEWFADRQIEFIFCCDANFGILPRDLELVRAVADMKQRKGHPHALSVQSTKNATERAYHIAKLMADSGLNKGVTISLQSLDESALANIKRKNISLQSFFELQRRFTRDKVLTYTDLILGLPGETYDSFVECVSQVIAGGQHNRIQFNNLCILPNAEMGDPAYRQRYGLETVASKIINLHGALAEDDEVPESQELVVATTSMPREAWLRTRAFCWMTALIHFDKLLQIPLILMHEQCGLSYRELLEAFSNDTIGAGPVLTSLRQFFHQKAEELQRGGAEYCRAPDWLNIWWPVDEYAFIDLCREGRLDAFYQEAGRTLHALLQTRGKALPPGVLDESLRFNRALINLPGQQLSSIFEACYNIWEAWQAALEGRPAILEPRSCRYRIDRSSNRCSSWEQWYRDVVWYGNKMGAYLHNRVTRVS